MAIYDVSNVNQNTPVIHEPLRLSGFLRDQSMNNVDQNIQIELPTDHHHPISLDIWVLG
ncbi:hypothetical protein [Xenorhabdus griffiniae]|uniref:Uncharacterized protein n=1 Tax=Xenorhabdus griffiniae TaxID=351672 RepID=A0ABY9XFB9_9GAMM|nr:hypothetical protein [Xenorhabdus griffiniae]MBD1226637.1 hypothetical protein [Xenorhabdus griffiniae]MBE8586177.1 hypothetical protein [Xenorhabdus griffiniae]WMV71588.1 hypothetical protein QL128_15745 [Xenorhabdus griffiniae]WNH01265.1 hypothetical protein QL112_015750 [Xenorhabdus griffiniae]